MDTEREQNTSHINPKSLRHLFKFPKIIIVRLKNILFNLYRINQLFDELKINQGVILSTLNKNKTSRLLEDYEFKVFSQWGEDGIIQHLINCVEITNKTFIEFGVEDFFESNCRFLLMKDNWRGFVIDGSKSNIDKLKQSYFYWKYHLEAVDAFITKENINELLEQSAFEKDIGILSVDIDGNDYYVLEAISFYNPRILICEYNSVFGKERKISVPYEPDFYRTKKHYSNLYFGASLAAMTHIAEKKGYTLVGTNSIGGNAFYVRNDLINEKLETLTTEQAYVPSNVRESRNRQGELTYITGDARRELIKGMPVFNVETNILEKL
jgi:hypothetical protein